VPPNACSVETSHVRRAPTSRTRILRERFGGRVRQHVRPGVQRPAHGVDLEGVGGDAQPEAMGFLRGGARDRRVE